MKKLSKLTGFEWDKGNIHKNWLKHQVSNQECEQIFFNKPLLILPDEIHSQKEKRYWSLGKTQHGRFLFIVFTVRKDKIRVISARDMSKKERKIYEQETKN